MFHVTREWIKENKTARGGWTKEQLAILGVHWPPVQGWIERVTSSQHWLTNFEKWRFEQLAQRTPLCSNTHPQA